MRLFALLAAPLLVAACAPAASAPAASGGRVVIFYPYDPDIALVGTTDGSKDVGCKPAEPRHIVELLEPSQTRVTLRGDMGAGTLDGATLRVTQLATKQTWCATMKNDDPVTLATTEELAKGYYAVSVSAKGTHRYEIVWEH